MPPEGYTTVTISDETTTKLAEIVVGQNLETVAEAIDYAVNLARDSEILSEAELAGLLHRKLIDKDRYRIFTVILCANVDITNRLSNNYMSLLKSQPQSTM